MRKFYRAERFYFIERWIVTRCSWTCKNRDIAAVRSHSYPTVKQSVKAVPQALKWKLPQRVHDSVSTRKVKKIFIVNWNKISIFVKKGISNSLTQLKLIYWWRMCSDSLDNAARTKRVKLNMCIFSNYFKVVFFVTLKF